MEDKNQIIEALGKVPGLVEAAEKILDGLEEFKKMIADLLKRQIHADIPEKELNKVGSAAATAVSQTRCALPDPAQISGRIAEQAASLFKASIHSEAKEAVKEAMKETPVAVKHEHSYYPTYEITKVANEKLAQRFWFMFAVTMLVVSLFTINALLYYDSETFIGKQYQEIYHSKYATDDERKMLATEVYDTGFVPREFAKTPNLVKAKIKRNKEILKQREAEAKANKGKFSTRVPLER